MKLKRHGGGMRRCKMLLRRRKSTLGVCTWIQMYDGLYQRLGTKEGGRTSIGWPKAERGRRGTSSK
jgi:hypothetical protein